MPGYFTPGTPLYNEEGGDILKGPRRVDLARRLLAESGYKGAPVTLMAAQDLANHKLWGEVTADVLRRLGVTVDYAAVDWGTLNARRVQKSPPGQGGWQMLLSGVTGLDCLDGTNRLLRTDGKTGSAGWAMSPLVEAEVAAWYDARSLDEEKAVARRLNRAAADHVVYAPLGFYLRHQAWRKNVSGVRPGPLPFAWDVAKMA
jgi:peptide/nickel transport system substrate-binding protein